MTSTAPARILASIQRDEGGDFEQLVEYGDVRYHLLLRFNERELDSQESVALRKLYDAMEQEDEDAIDLADDECTDITWPLMFADYEARSRTGALPNETIKLQAVTTDGVLHAVHHDLSIKYPSTQAVENTFPGIPTFRTTEVEQLDTIESNIFKVRVGNQVYCLKNVHRTGHEGNFIREVSVLQHCSHENIIPLVGLVVDEEDKVEGMLTVYLNNARLLRSMETFTREQCEVWTKQIHEAIEYLHRKGLVWGDAKPANVLVRDSDSVVLVDFGGGNTEGWVDKDKYETTDGDWQGYQRIVEFMSRQVR